MHTYNTYLEIFKKGEFQLIHNFDASVVFVVKFSTLFRLVLAILCMYIIKRFCNIGTVESWFVHCGLSARISPGKTASKRGGLRLVWCGLYYSVQWGCYFYCTTMAEISKKLSKIYYRTRAIISRSRFEAALVYKPRILGLKNEEFPFLVHKLSAI